jgi:hypothetical protein
MGNFDFLRLFLRPEPLEMKAICSFLTSGTGYPATQRKVPEGSYPKLLSYFCSLQQPFSQNRWTWKCSWQRSYFVIGRIWVWISVGESLTLTEIFPFLLSVDGTEFESRWDKGFFSSLNRPDLFRSLSSLLFNGWLLEFRPWGKAARVWSLLHTPTWCRGWEWVEL